MQGPNPSLLGSRWRAAILAGMTVAAVLAGLAAVGTVRARGRVRQATMASLSNYAAVAAEQFVNAYEASVRQNFVQILPFPNVSDAKQPIPVSDLTYMMARLQRDPCSCFISPSATIVFRIGLDTDDYEAVDSSGQHRLPRDPDLVSLVRIQVDSLTTYGVRLGFVLGRLRDGDQVVFFNRRADSLTGHRYAYGFAMDPSTFAARLLDPVVRTIRLFPRSLRGSVSENAQYLDVEVSGRRGESVYASSNRFPTGATDALRLPDIRGGFVVRARLNPAVTDRLIPGGVPSKVPVRELVLIALSLGVVATIAALGLRAADLARLRSDFASSVTHELRTPLTQIRLAAETVLLGRSKSADSERRSLSSIVDETRRLQQLIDNVLHFSRAERHMTRVSAEPLALEPLISDTIATFAPLADLRSATIHATCEPELVVRGDPNALRQILLNLLDNAVRYGPDGQTIQVVARAVGKQAEISIQDQGPGIPEADRNRVWEAFTRLDRDRETASTGTGLGLAVVRELVNAQGGQVGIEPSNPVSENGSGTGARVIIRLDRWESS